MNIVASSIQLAASHTAVTTSEQQESIVAWQKGKEPTRADGQHGHHGHHGKLKHQAEKLAQAAAKVSLSEAAKQQAAEVQEPVETEDSPEDSEVMANLNMRILKAMFAKLTGRWFKMTAVEADQQAPPPEQVEAAESPVDRAKQGWGVVYERHASYHESETTQFAAQGVVVTADGQQIEIGVELNMSRSFTATLDETIRMGDATLKDPLVINFEGTAAQLTQTSFAFDIDADGAEDQIAFVGPGSGLLALDANNDGVVNNGSELFGALSGDGFADLAAFDADRNGWIDEGDAIYSRLRIWTKTAAGEDQLIALGDRGVGAIYLGRAETPFSIKDSSNTLQGQIRSTGLFLFEEGGAGTVQQLDLVA